jgi:hypothetical protein
VTAPLSTVIVTQKSAEICPGLECVADDNCGENCSTRHAVSQHLITDNSNTVFNAGLYGGLISN